MDVGLQDEDTRVGLLQLRLLVDLGGNVVLIAERSAKVESQGAVLVPHLVDGSHNVIASVVI